MALTHIPLEEITKKHLDQLINSKSPESKYIEYKQETYGRKDADRKEFLADISSFANTDGGDIIIGMKEVKNIPISYIPWSDCDKEIERLENIAQSSLEPRICNLSARKITITDNEYVVIIRISRSFYLPHRVVYQGTNRFYMRSSTGKYEPNVEELRRLFNAAPKFIKLAKEWRLDRISKILHQQTPVTLSSNRLLLMHFIPNSAFNLYQYITPNEIVQKRISFTPIGRHYSTDNIIDIDSITYLSTNGDPHAKHHCYTSVFNSGIVEAVVTIYDEMYISHVADYIKKTTKPYIENLHKLGFETPLLLVISMIGTNGMILRHTTDEDCFPGDSPSKKINEPELSFRVIELNKLLQNDDELVEILSPFLNQLANASGLVNYPTT